MIDVISYRYCVFDDLPINESPIYLTLRDEYGSKVANRYARVKRVEMNHPPPRGNEHAGSVVLDLGREREYQLSSRSGLSRQAEYPDPIQTVEAG